MYIDTNKFTHICVYAYITCTSWYLLITPINILMESLCYLIVGSMCFMSGSVEMENAYLPENEVGIWQWLFGKTITSIVLRNSGPSDGFVGIAAPYFARILPVCTSMPLQLS